MTVTLNAPLNADDVLQTVRGMAGEIAARAPEIEAARRVPLDLIDRLKAAGCFRVLLPASHGGGGWDLASAMRLYEELSRADASTAWVTLIGGGAWVDLSGLPRPTFDSTFPAGANTIVAGAFSPSGVAVPVAGGYQVNGRWGFASGCEHADWIYGNCVDTSSGEPKLRIALFHPSEVEIEDTWTVSGLGGTGSHHFAVRDLVVSADRTYNLFTDPHAVDTPLLHIPTPAFLATAMASVALGIALSAIDDVLALATNKTPLLSPSVLAANPLFQNLVAEADVKLRAARSLLYEEVGVAWARAVDGAEFDPPFRARLRAAALFATTTAADVVTTCYRAGGGSSLYGTSTLQRRLRDVNAVSQHFLLKADTLTTCGAIMAGQQPNIEVF